MSNRKVILFIATSLDGYIADKHGNIEWLQTNTTNDEPDNSYNDFYQGVDTVIMGSTTYDQVTRELSPMENPYKDSITYVLTSKNKQNLDNVEFINQSVIDLANYKFNPNKPGNFQWQSGDDGFLMVVD